MTSYSEMHLTSEKNLPGKFLTLDIPPFFLLNLKPHITNENMIAAHTLKNAKFRTKYKQVPTILNHQKNAIKITKCLTIY